MRSTRVHLMLLAVAVLLMLLPTNASAVGPAAADSISSAIDFQGSGQVDFTQNTLASPEPRALALFGAGLLGVVHVARRRRRPVSRI